MNKRIFISALSAVLALVLAGSAAAQIHGVPAGATSLGTGHTFRNPVGVPAGATSLGPRGFGFGSRVGTVPLRRRGFDRDFDHDRDDRLHRVILPYVVPLYGYYPYIDSQYVGTDMSTADYRMEQQPVTSPLMPPPVVVQAPQPQVIVIDERGARDATTEEKDSAIAASKAAKKPKQETVKDDTKAQTEDSGPMTVVVFRDGTRKEVKNYAIMGKELIELGSGSLRRFQIADIDVPATMKENDGRGLDFRMP